ncbi:hypothetical protein C8R45DRAFT_935252 [Mycena sanguinolenta]|nr:hypothetical protein C8R45DRAFT_935252 [Mycena sanguinolenta]
MQLLLEHSWRTVKVGIFGKKGSDSRIQLIPGQRPLNFNQHGPLVSDEAGPKASLAFISTTSTRCSFFQLTHSSQLALESESRVTLTLKLDHIHFKLALSLFHSGGRHYGLLTSRPDSRRDLPLLLPATSVTCDQASLVATGILLSEGVVCDHGKCRHCKLQVMPRSILDCLAYSPWLMTGKSLVQFSNDFEGFTSVWDPPPLICLDSELYKRVLSSAPHFHFILARTRPKALVPAVELSPAKYWLRISSAKLVPTPQGLYSNSARWLKYNRCMRASEHGNLIRMRAAVPLQMQRVRARDGRAAGEGGALRNASRVRDRDHQREKEREREGEREREREKERAPPGDGPWVVDIPYDDDADAGVGADSVIQLVEAGDADYPQHERGRRHRDHHERERPRDRRAPSPPHGLEGLTPEEKYWLKMEAEAQGGRARGGARWGSRTRAQRTTTSTRTRSSRVRWRRRGDVAYSSSILRRRQRGDRERVNDSWRSWSLGISSYDANLPEREGTPPKRVRTALPHPQLTKRRSEELDAGEDAASVKRARVGTTTATTTH